jgi:hypothetical protein
VPRIVNNTYNHIDPNSGIGKTLAETTFECLVDRQGNHFTWLFMCQSHYRQPLPQESYFRLSRTIAQLRRLIPQIPTYLTRLNLKRRLTNSKVPQSRLPRKPRRKRRIYATPRLPRLNRANCDQNHHHQD